MLHSIAQTAPQAVKASMTDTTSHPQTDQPAQLRPGDFAKFRTSPAASAQKKTCRKLNFRFKDALFLTAIIIFGFIAQYIVLGQLLILAYGIIAVITKVSSRVSYSLALIAMSCMAVMAVVRPDSDLPENFATYTFALIVIGTISLARELSRENKAR